MPEIIQGPGQECPRWSTGDFRESRYNTPINLNTIVGRYQPFHNGHRSLILEGLKRVGQVCIAVRDTVGTSGKDPFRFEYVKAWIEGR